MAGACTVHGKWKDTEASHVLANDHAEQKPGRLRKNWIDTIHQDLKTIGIVWEDVEHSAINREDWWWSVAQCDLSLSKLLVTCDEYHENNNDDDDDDVDSDDDNDDDSDDDDDNGNDDACDFSWWHL